MVKDEFISYHTPAPWVVEDHGYDGLTVISIRDGKRCTIAAELYDEAVEPTLIELAANAYLISAAPDLLKSCEKLLSIESLYSTSDKELQVEIVMMKLAIQKAQGK